jgi:hypothetical protein
MYMYMAEEVWGCKKDHGVVESEGLVAFRHNDPGRHVDMFKVVMLIFTGLHGMVWGVLRGDLEAGPMNS